MNGMGVERLNISLSYDTLWYLQHNCVEVIKCYIRLYDY